MAKRSKERTRRRATKRRRAAVIAGSTAAATAAVLAAAAAFHNRNATPLDAAKQAGLKKSIYKRPNDARKVRSIGRINIGPEEQQGFYVDGKKLTHRRALLMHNHTKEIKRQEAGAAAAKAKLMQSLKYPKYRARSK